MPAKFELTSEEAFQALCSAAGTFGAAVISPAIVSLDHAEQSEPEPPAKARREILDRAIRSTANFPAIFEHVLEKTVQSRTG